MNPRSLELWHLRTLSLIPDGDAGTHATLAIMAELVRAYRMDAKIRAQAESIIAGIPPKDAYREAKAVQEWVRDHIRYTGDVHDVETIRDPVLLLRSRFGDCDDMTTLAAALMESIGLATELVAVAFAGGEFSHVLGQVEVGGSWIPFETTEPVSFGWYPLGVSKEMVVPV